MRGGFSLYVARETPGVKWQCAVYCRRFAHSSAAKPTYMKSEEGNNEMQYWVEWPYDLSGAYGEFQIRETVADAYTDLTKLKMGSMQNSSVYSPFAAMVVEVPVPTTIFRRLIFAIDESQALILDKEKVSK